MCPRLAGFHWIYKGRTTPRKLSRRTISARICLPFDSHVVSKRRIRMKRITAVSVCGAFALAGWSISVAMARPTAPVVLQDDVKQVYLNKCSVCHGEDGAGKTAKGKKLK